MNIGGETRTEEKKIHYNAPSQKGMKILAQNQSPRKDKSTHPNRPRYYYPGNSISKGFSPPFVHILSIRLFHRDGLCPDREVA